VALTVLVATLTLATPASAAGEDLTIPEEFRDVVEGDSVPINVTFGTLSDDEDDEADIRVTCDGCPTWIRTVTFDEEKANCETTDAFVDTEDGQAKRSEAVCRISFPEGFRDEDGGPRPAEIGEPARTTTYDVRMGVAGEEARTTFQAHLSSASTCRPLPGETKTGVGQRTDVLLLSTSGHPQGEEVTLTIRSANTDLFERTFQSAGESIAYHFRWQVPLDLPIEGDGREATLIVDAASGGETETIALRPAVAQASPFLQPGRFNQSVEYNRTQEVNVQTGFDFFAAPQDCKDVAWNRDIQPVREDQVGDDPPRVLVRRLSEAPGSPPVETVDTADTVFRASDDFFLVNYTIPRDADATEAEEEDPVYDVKFEETELADGNYIGEWNSTDYEVYPYEIEPEFAVLQEEVERLETASLVMNLTYADGSPFTPADADGDLEVAFGLEGEDPEFQQVANHRGDGVWNVSFDLGFDYEPLGEYTWRISELRDNNGPRGERNRVPETVTDVVDVVSARPRLNVTTIVDDTRVESVERTQRVQVRVDARFQNGQPLTEENIDPAIGGIGLDVDKRNEFGRVVDQDSYVMKHAGDPGTWIESFRIGRSPSSAPVGTWDLSFEARDDRTPANENVTSVPFRVNPANVTVADQKAPPQLVNSSQVSYEFRLNYPDGSLVSERLVDESRGGQLDIRLERVTRADQPATVERELEPRPVAGGQAWRVQMNTSKIVPGTHFFNVTGQDVHGNAIGPQASDLFTVLFNGEFRNSTTPICPESEQGCSVQRGETVYVVFPGASGDQGMFGERPEIRVLRQDEESGRWILFREDVWLSSQQFFNQTGRDAGNNHVGRFSTDRSTPADTYRLVMLGRDNEDRGFVGYSQTFNVTRVPVEREIVQPFPDRAKKTEEIAARIESRAGDVIDSTVVDAGPIRARNIQTDTTGVGTFLRWQPPSTFPTGPASVTVEGRDLFGNPFEVELGPIDLQPVEIRTQQVGQIATTAPRGQLFSFDLQMTYETGTTFTAGDGEPQVRVVDATGSQVDSGRASFQGETWEIRWRPPADLSSGNYRVEVTGTDRSGNVVEDFTTAPISVVAGTVRGEPSQQPPSNVRRGERVQAALTFPAAIEEGQAVVTTGTDEVGEPQTTIDGSTVRLSFPTDRSTGLVDARFSFTGTDIVGNNITGQTDRFSVRAQEMAIRWIEQPPTEVTKDQPVEAAFVVEYPDGTPMRPSEGAPIVGLFAADQPLGQINATPLEDNPVVWTTSWEPPEDVRTDIAYRFSASARDSFRNEAPPVSSQGFFVQNPVVPDYVPVDAPGAVAALAALAGLALALRREQRA